MQEILTRLIISHGPSMNQGPLWQPAKHLKYIYRGQPLKLPLKHACVWHPSLTYLNKKNQLQLSSYNLQVFQHIT